MPRDFHHMHKLVDFMWQWFVRSLLLLKHINMVEPKPLCSFNSSKLCPSEVAEDRTIRDPPNSRTTGELEVSTDSYELRPLSSLINYLGLYFSPSIFKDTLYAMESWTGQNYICS
jgi:hypothetical protein